jgi:hypothetical protein
MVPMRGSSHAPVPSTLASPGWKPDCLSAAPAWRSASPPSGSITASTAPSWTARAIRSAAMLSPCEVNS